jgi:CRP-like cAMP-binding protein
MRLRKERALTKEQIGDLVAIMRRVDLFAEADEDDLRRLAGEMREREVADGTEVVRENRLPAYVYLIAEGHFDVIFQGEKGAEARVVNTLGPGDHFGEIGLIEGMPATATVRARGRARVAEIPGRAFLLFVEESASLGDVADRISGWLARTHPSYRPSTGTAPVTDGKRRLDDLAGGWDQEERALLERAIDRLGELSPEERRRRLGELGG